MESDKPKEFVKLSSFQRFRKGLSDALCLAAIACLSIVVLIVCYMWLYAWQHNLYPRVPIPENAYRGAWSSDLTLTHISDQVLTPLSCAFLAAILSYVVKPNVRAGITLLASVICVFILIGHISLLED